MIKKAVLCVAFGVQALFATAQQMTWNSQYQTYIDQYRDLAIEQMLRYKIPASITLAQGIFESGAGRSRLATQGNNHFGIKCGHQCRSSSEGRVAPSYPYLQQELLPAGPQGRHLQSIGREIGISGRKIAKYNERDYDSPLVPNELIWLKKKQKRADEAYEGRPHRVKAGDSMYGIAQYYGIRLKSLYKMNHLKSSYELHVGDLLRVR